MSRVCLLSLATLLTCARAYEDHTAAPQALQPDVVASESGTATLRCLFHGNPTPTITWRFRGHTIDSNANRYRLILDGTLEINPLYRSDTGVYTCVADNGLGVATQEVHLVVNGFGCQYALHGCCPDNVTIAKGADNQGCGCLYTQHGCCPDRHTVATGPNNEGCACNTYQFGCCVDGVTSATGPEQQGCHCRESEFGCCGDGETHATGPDAAGCDCSSSRHGCCPDGRTEATGPKFIGCTDAPKNKQAACGLSRDVGPCHNFTAMWFYDLAYGGCSRFWYGGCDGNSNRFVTKEECEDVCVQPSPKDACKLPSVKGACNGEHQRWHYNSTREQCISFNYGGCLGNANNFDTLELCQKQCEPSFVAETTTEFETYERSTTNEDTTDVSSTPTLDPCSGFEFGCCADNETQATSPALSGCGCQYALHGCCPDNVTVAQGADNQGCGCLYTQHGCCPDRHTVATGPNNEGCACNTYQFGCCADGVTSATGPEQQGCHCRESEFGCRRDGETHATSPDAAGCDCSSSQHGCCPDGCTEATGPKFLGCTDAPKNKQAACGLSKDIGPCHNFTAMWYYDLSYGGCSRFWYGGCDGNGNRFVTKEECEDVCVQPSPKDACKLPSVKGACDGEYQRWHYNSTREQCISFNYGGCLGNANNFDTLELCQKQCEPSSVAGSVAIRVWRPVRSTLRRLSFKQTNP